MRVVFFGTPKFAADILKYLLEKNVEIIAVITRPDKPKGRSKTASPSPVKELADGHSIPVYQPQKTSDPEFIPVLKALQADLFIVAAFAEILKTNVLELPRIGCINVHGSILPAYRGAAPIQRAVMAGEKESGVTIMKMALELDAGDILSIAKTPITEDMTSGELTDKLAELGSEALWEVVQKLEKGEIPSIAQDSTKATYAKKLKHEDGEISWSRPFEEVYNHIRGVTPKPGAWVWVEVKGEKKRLVIRKARKEFNIQGKPGEIVSKSPYELVIACQNGGIRLLEIQLEGKKAMPSDAFLRGISLDKLKFLK